MIGLGLGIGLAQAGLDVAVIDRETPAALVAPAFDGRSSAIAHASAQLLRVLGVWRHLDAAQPIQEIRVSDGPSRLFVHFDHRALGDEPLGYMVENRHLRIALQKAAAETPGLTLMAPAEVTAVHHAPGHAAACLADGRQVRARLACAADGRGSALRKDAGIGMVAWRYRQAGRNRS